MTRGAAARARVRTEVRWGVILAALALATPPAALVGAAGQAPTPPDRAQATGTPAPSVALPQPAGLAQPAEGYTYRPEGRRDPFVGLIASRADIRTGKRPDGLAGQLIDEVTLKGIIHNRDDYAALLQAPDGRTYIARAGERLYDGVIKSIAATSLVFLQEVNDPLSLTKQREKRMSLRALEEGK